VVRDGIPHNLLTRSEEFENVAWSMFPSVSDVDIQANAAISPDGQETTEIISTTVTNAGVDQTVSAVPSSTYAFMAWIRSEIGTTVIIMLNTNLNSRNKVITSTSQWQLFSISRFTDIGKTSITSQIQINNTNSTIQLWGAQLNMSSWDNNVVLKSDDFQGFGTTRTWLNPINVRNPSGAMGATKLVADRTNVTHRASVTVRSKSLTNYTLSMYIMKNEHRFVRIACTGSGSNQFFNVFFLSRY